MKNTFRSFTGLHAGMYKRSGGRLGGRMRGLNVLLLTTTGRRSGITHTTPLGQFDHPEGYVIVASNAGLPANPAWYYNLKNDPHVTIQVLRKVMSATAQELTGEARLQAWRQVIAAAPGYAAYEKRTRREIPLILLRPDR